MALTFEIHGTSVHHRGTELVAVTIAERLRQRFPDCRIVVPPSFGPFLTRGKYGFFTTWEMATGIRTKTVTRFAPPPMKRVFGIVDPKDIDVVFDVSGFSQGDSTALAGAARLVSKMKQSNRRHQTLILMPQALGPFDKPGAREMGKKLIDRAALVCARDDTSYEAASELCDGSKLRRCPDVTAGINARFPSEVAFPPHFSAIVPNRSLLRKAETNKAYLDFLFYAVFALGKRHLNPLLLVHDNSEDIAVVEALRERGHDVTVLQHADPRALKGMLGRATLVVGSRFHALFGALSQGVPCIGAGEVPTYRGLFKDFGCEDLLLPDVKDLRTFEQQLELLGDTTSREKRRVTLVSAAERMSSEVKAMWVEVEQLIEQRAS